MRNCFVTEISTVVSKFVKQDGRDLDLITLSNDTVSTFRDWFRQIGIRSRGSPAVAQIFLCSVKRCLSVSEIGAFVLCVMRLFL